MVTNPPAQLLFVLITDAEGYPKDQYRLWLEVEKTFTSTISDTPINIADVRSFMNDRCPGDNPLLGAMEFSDDQIQKALYYPIDEWNTTPPVIYTYSLVTFPYKTAWLGATAAYLLQVAAMRYVRNNLAYSAGGSQIDDMNKGEPYLQISELLKGEWKMWMAAKKRADNIDNGWGTVSIGGFGE